MLEFIGHSNASANSLEFDRAPFTLNLSGECTSRDNNSFDFSGEYTEHQG